MSSFNFDAGDFPRLSEFARGYLHQDVLREYGSAEGAVRAYLADLNQDERKEAAKEAERLGILASELSPEESSEALGKLGAAWRAVEAEQFFSVLLAFRETDHPA